ncbi:NAD(P)-dependent oxidoreductase [Aurantimonas sp. C2-5-R2]|uniref:NAD(P)-dependent oxidoreductase n=1 Tax=Aurantimonas sp. C2-5-R2 TaxID=3113713 RepID=UPI002F953671
MENRSSGAGPRVGFVGLGTMGAPMVRALIAAKRPLCLFDIDRDLTARLATETGARAAETLSELGAASDLVITMLPNAAIVRGALLGEAGSKGVADGLSAGAVVVDMSSSYPVATQALGEELAAREIALVDAPVSGGVRKAESATLAIMLGGDDADAIETVTPILEAMGAVHRTGRLGSGHATKALNNYVSAAGLAAACEAVIVGEAFGLDPAMMIDVINVSTGRNNSTENKLKPFILSGEFRKAGFALDLMAKDVTAAADLSDALGCPLPGLTEARTLWTQANRTLGKGADHTEIFRFLADFRHDDPA